MLESLTEALLVPTLVVVVQGWPARRSCGRELLVSCICVDLFKCAVAAYDVLPVCGLLLSPFLDDVRHRFSQEELPLLQLIVRPDHNGCVHVEDHEVHDDDEDDENDGGDFRVRFVHLRVRELAQEHLEAEDR